MNKVIVIVGPTGVGKTRLSIELAKCFNSEIINGDSVQIYKELNIGSAKITEEEKKGIKHHLLDLKNIEDNYTIFDYKKDVTNKIEEFKSKGLLPIIVGGSGLYLKAALYDYQFEEEKEGYLNTYAKYTNEEAYEILKNKDPHEALKMHPNNRRRVLRALQIISNTEMSKTELLSKQKKEPHYDVIFIGLRVERKILYERINERVDNMMKNGLLEEARELYIKYSDQDYKALNSIGYKELFSYFKGEISIDEAIECIKKKSRNYAKRQDTWFNNQFNVKWFEVSKNFNETTKEIINYLKEQL